MGFKNVRVRGKTVSGSRLNIWGGSGLDNDGQVGNAWSGDLEQEYLETNIIFMSDNFATANIYISSSIE